MIAKKQHKILAVDDDRDILELLEYNLKKEGYIVKTEEDSRKALNAARIFKPDFIILDIMMPYQDGVETCRILREIPDLKDVYILFLTARSEEYSEVAAFESGADDYLIKPIRPRALTSRINTIIRRWEKKDVDFKVIDKDDLVIDKSSYTVTIGKKQITLPRKEFDLLYFLAEHPNKIYSREMLLSNVWGSEVHVLSRTVDVHIRKIREKIGDKHIVTIKGVGYKFHWE